MTGDLLAGVRVLDLTNVLAGPYAGYQLALLGADVVKVETVSGGDLARHLGASRTLSDAGMGVSFLAQNADKRSIAVDLKSDAGKEVFADLVRGADVLLENFRPGVMERLGFGWETLHALNPTLVACAVSGFGQEGPMRDRPAYDQIIQGLSGLMSVTGSPEVTPLRVGAPLCDSMGGLAAAMAICAALVRQRVTGQGARLDVSMLDTAITAMGWVVSDKLIADVEPLPMANENRTSAPSGTFATADGKLNIAANKQEQWEELCRTLGRDDLLSDPRFVTRDERKEHRAELKTALEETLRTRSATEWDKLLLQTSVPAAPVLSVHDALDSDQVAARGLVSEIALSEDTTVSLLGSPVWVDGAGVGPSAPPPRLGEHTDQILEGLGYDAERVAELRASGVIA